MIFFYSMSLKYTTQTYSYEEPDVSKTKIHASLND